MDQPERRTATVSCKAVINVFSDVEIDRTAADVSGWQKVCAVDEIPRLGARVVKSMRGDIAVFRNADDEIFALLDKCPHKGGPLSQGIVFGRKVACPLHGWNIGLEDGNAVAPDVGCAQRFETRVENGVVLLKI
jgi:nitrite reductase (NADH) small subunit